MKLIKKIKLQRLHLYVEFLIRLQDSILQERTQTSRNFRSQELIQQVTTH